MEGVKYMCRQCSQKIVIKPGDMVRCKKCEGVILDKLPTPGARKYVAR